MKKLVFSILLILILSGCPFIQGSGQGLVSVIMQKDGSGIFNSGVFILTLEPLSGTAGETRQKSAALSGHDWQTITAFSGLEDGTWELTADIYQSTDPENPIYTTGSYITIAGQTEIEVNIQMVYEAASDSFTADISSETAGASKLGININNFDAFASAFHSESLPTTGYEYSFVMKVNAEFSGSDSGMLDFLYPDNGSYSVEESMYSTSDEGNYYFLNSPSGPAYKSAAFSGDFPLSGNYTVIISEDSEYCMISESAGCDFTIDGPASLHVVSGVDTVISWSYSHPENVSAAILVFTGPPSGSHYDITAPQEFITGNQELVIFTMGAIPSGTEHLFIIALHSNEPINESDVYNYGDSDDFINQIPFRIAIPSGIKFESIVIWECPVTVVW